MLKNEHTLTEISAQHNGLLKIKTHKTACGFTLSNKTPANNPINMLWMHTMS